MSKNLQPFEPLISALMVRVKVEVIAWGAVPPFIDQKGGVPPGRVSVQLFLIGKGAALRPMMLLWLALLPTSCIFDTSSCQLADKQRTVQ